MSKVDAEVVEATHWRLISRNSWDDFFDLQTTHLRKVFQFCQQGLREAAGRLGPNALSPEDRALLRRLLLLSEQLLSWNFQFAMPRILFDSSLLEGSRSTASECSRIMG